MIKKLFERWLVKLMVQNAFLRMENERLKREKRALQWDKFAIKLIVLPAEADHTDDNLFRELLKKFPLKSSNR